MNKEIKVLKEQIMNNPRVFTIAWLAGLIYMNNQDYKISKNIMD